MQFSDPQFLFAFLPATVFAYYLCGWWSTRLAMLVLTVASLMFYGCAGLHAVAVLVGSIAVNYVLGRLLLRLAPAGSGLNSPHDSSESNPPPQGRGNDRTGSGIEPSTAGAAEGSPFESVGAGATSEPPTVGPAERSNGGGQRQPAARLVLVWIGVIANVALLAYFKYRGFFIENVAAALGGNLQPLKLWVPLGVSFYTFQKVAFLVDVYRGKVKECPALEFALFSTFFPQVTSGPITRAREMLPQFATLSARFDPKGFTEGLSIFIVGLAKKVLIADAMGTVAGPAFDSFAGPHTFGAAGAWVGVLAYSMQIYYDFSGYSEMALGLAKMVNLKLPCNFNAPYKANSIIGFWARWHMSLSRWLRDYVFLTIANPYHFGKRIFGLLATMLICGLWHGAGWTFVVWGGLHGVFLAVNHTWREVAERYPRYTAPFTSKRMRPLGRLITFVAVAFAWVFFRAPSLTIAGKMLAAMAGAGGVGALVGFAAYPAGLVLGVVAFTFLAPDTVAFFSLSEPCLEKMPVRRTRFQWNAGWPSAAVIGLLVFLIVRSHMVAAESVRFTYSNF